MLNTLGAFIFEDILCRWGALAEIVTDNGPAFVKALDYLAKKYRIWHIRISPYNSRANGIVERAHRPLRDSLLKAVDGDESKWYTAFHAVLWAERVTTHRTTGYSSYWIAHGIEPLFPFDLSEATYMTPAVDAPMSTDDLIALRARQLQKRPEDLAAIADRLYKARQESVKDFMVRNAHSIIDYDLRPGALILVRNSSVDNELNRKIKPRFFGPMVVVQRTQGGSYRLAELDGTVSKMIYAAFRLVPYFPRSHISVPLDKLTGLANENDSTTPKDDRDDPLATSDKN
jgi:hypothetical protein